MEQLLTHTLNVITVQQPFTLAWNQAMQRMLPIRERQIAQVFTITEKQIEGVVRGSPRRNDVHKKMLAVVVADVEVDGEYQFERRRFSSSPDNLRLPAEWLIEREVEEVVIAYASHCTSLGRGETFSNCALFDNLTPLAFFGGSGPGSS